MNKLTLNFTANEQELVNNSGRLLFASDTVSYVTAEFELGTNWDGEYDSVRAVWKSKTHVIATELDSNGACTVPHEVLTEKGEVLVNLVGSIVEDGTLSDRLTTYAVAALSVVQKVRVEGDAEAAITPSMIEQVIAEVKGDAQSAAGAAQSASESASSASQSASAASGSATTASTKAGEAASSASNAAASATAAAASETAASNSATAAAGSATSAASSAAAAAEVASAEVVEQLREYKEATEANATAAAASASDASYQRSESLSAKTAAEQAAADAAASAQQAANVFQLAGSTSFSVDSTTKKVTMHVTVSE